MERFADIQLLRYKLTGFENLSLQQKLYIYHLAKATEAGRDITFDQFGEYNLAIRQLLEEVYLYCSENSEYSENPEISENSESSDNSRLSDNLQNFRAFEVYLERVWFSSGIHHHYGMEKFKPEFSREWLEEQLNKVSLPFSAITSQRLLDIIFTPTLLPKRVNKAEGEDLIKTSACNFYQGVSQEEVEAYYNKKKEDYNKQKKDYNKNNKDSQNAEGHDNKEMPSFGLNSTLTKDGEQVWRINNNGKYAKELTIICHHLQDARQFAENDKQKKLIDLLIDYYHTGDLRTFDEYSKLWVTEKDGEIDFINGFIEVYGDPLGYKGSWEGLVEYVDHEATKKTRLIADNAQWFEDNSPVDPRFKKPVVKGVSARVICAAMLGGDEYPSTAIGINLPNADWIREQYGSKSITISNIIAAYNEAAKGSPMKREFTCDEEMIALIDKYADQCDSLHTDLHECLGHGSGQLLPGVSTDALKNYFSTIEEARADLFGLYYCADDKMIELGLLLDAEAYKSMYYTYILNGLLTQLVRIKLGDKIEEDHMRNRALIARWAMDLAKKPQFQTDLSSAHSLPFSAITSPSPILNLYNKAGKTYLRINDFAALRSIFAYQLAEIQRIKSEGDYEEAKRLIEKYAVNIDPELHKEILDRYEKLNIAPYKGFINPVLNLVTNDQGEVIDVVPDYTESYTEQMLRYSRTSKQQNPETSKPRNIETLNSRNLESSKPQNLEIAELRKSIIKKFRLYMDGVAARSMREKGVEYKVNWGIKIGDLKKIAEEIKTEISNSALCTLHSEQNSELCTLHPALYDLSIDLWKSNTRECKILATMLMPAEQFTEDLANLWLEQTLTKEIAQYLAFFLIQYTDFSATLAFRWIASNNEIAQECGYNTLSSLISKGRLELTERDRQELIDQALSVRSHAALNCLNKIEDERL